MTAGAALADLPGVLATLALGVFGGGAVWAYLRDRRKASAEGDVARQTVELQVDASRMANLEQRFALAEKAWDEERESMARRLAASEAREAALELDLERKNAKILELESRVQQLQSDLTRVAADLADLSRGPVE